MLRDMAWLTPQRAKLYGSGMAIALAAIFALFALIIYRRGGFDLSDNAIGPDFSSFWAASRQVLVGRSADVYVPRLHQLAELPYSREYEAFFYPPTYLLICLPLALAPFFVSYVAFVSTTAALFTAIIWRILKSPRSLVAVLSYPVTYMDIIGGQNGFLTAAILGCGLSIIDRQPRLAGVVLGLMVIKPHLALGAPIALVVTGRWRTLAWAGISSVGLVILSYLLFGSDTWLGFLNISPAARQTLENGDVNFGQQQSVFAMVRLLGAGVRTAWAVHGLGALCAVFFLIWSLRQPISAAAERSIIVLACLLITPFSLFYDMLIVALPLAWMLREWQSAGFPPWSKLVLCLVFLAPMVLYAPIIYNFTFVGPLPFGPAAILLFSWLLVREIAKTRRGGCKMRASAA